MNDFTKLDITEGFVLAQGRAIEYLKWIAEETVSQAIDNPIELDYENASEIIKDVMLMGREILDRNFEWIKFSECPMSASGIMIKPMVEKE